MGRDFKDTPTVRGVPAPPLGSVWVDLADPKFGAVMDGSTDDTAAIQAALDYALTLRVSMADVERGLPVVRFPARPIVYSSQLTWEGVHIRGDATGQGTVLIWKGAGGAAAGFKRTETVSGDGGTSWGLLEDIAFVTLDADSSLFPTTYLDLETGSGAFSLDFGLILHRVWFKNWTSAAVKLKGAICANWEQIRWTNNSASGNCYAVSFKGRSGESNHEFSLTNFEMDYGSSCAPDGFFYYDGTDNTSTPGVISLRNGHVEVNATMTGNKGFIVLVGNATSNRDPNISLSDIAIQGSTGMSLVACPNTNGTSTRPVITATNIQASTLTALVNGSGLQSGYPVPLLGQGSYHRLDLNKNAATVVARDTSTTYAGGATFLASSKTTNEVYGASDTVARLATTDTGKLQWGSGSATNDVTLTRVGAGQLVIGGAAASLRLGDTNGSGVNWELYSGSIAAGKFSIYDATASKHRLALDATIGRLLVATDSALTTPAGALHVASNTEASNYLAYHKTDTTSPILFFRKSRNTQASPATVANNDSILSLRTEAHDGTSYVSDAMRIEGQVDGTVSTGIVPGRLLFYTQSTAGTSTERMRIDSSGKVGIGTTAPAGLFHTASNSEASHYLAFHNDNSTSPILIFRKSHNTQASPTAVASGDSVLSLRTESHDGTSYVNNAVRIEGEADAAVSTGIVPGRLRFLTQNSSGTSTERMRIDSAGLVGIGTASTAVGSQLHVSTDGTASTRGVSVDQHDTGTTSAQLLLRKSRGTLASPTGVSSGDTIGEITFLGYNSNASAYQNAASIQAAVDASASDSSTDMPGRLLFYTTANASSTLTERMRIGNDGNVGIGTAGAGSNRLHVRDTGAGLIALFDSGSGAGANRIRVDAATGSNAGIAFSVNGSTKWGVGTLSGGNFTVNSSGDLAGTDAFTIAPTTWVATFAGNLTMTDAKDIVVGSSTGTKIGTATTQKLGFFNATPQAQITDGAALTNNVTSGGTTNTVDNWTNLSTYSTDAAAIRNAVYQLARKLKIVDDALRLYGLLS